MSKFDLQKSRKDLENLSQSVNDKLYNILNQIHYMISSFEYTLLDYTSPLFSYDVAKIVDEYVLEEIDWNSYDNIIKINNMNNSHSNTIKLDNIYNSCKRQLKLLMREKNAGFPYQAEKVTITWYDDEYNIKSKVYYKVCLWELDLPRVHIYRIDIDDLYTSKGNVEDLWRFILRNSHSLKTTSTMTFPGTRIHECEMIGYMYSKIKPLLYEMSNHSYASYNFSSYTMICGETRLDLYKFLVKYIDNNDKLIKEYKSISNVCLQELIHR